MSVGKRLKEERIRLGYSQEELATAVGLHRNTQAMYERGDRVPSAHYLSEMEKLSADVTYIVTGNSFVRKPVELGRECAIVFNIVEALETALVTSGRNLSPEKKGRAASMLFRQAYPSGLVDAEMIQEVIALAE